MQTNTKGYSNEEWWAMLDSEQAAVVIAYKDASGKGKRKVKKYCQASCSSGVDTRDGNGDGNASAPAPASANAGNDQLGQRAHSEGSGNRSGGNANSD